MLDNFRLFDAGPDPFGRTWRVQFLWLQNGITIRHSNSVDVKFTIAADGAEPALERVVALMHPLLLQLSEETGRALTDPWCMKLAALHLKKMIETEEDLEKIIVAPSLDELREYARQLAEPAAAQR